MEHSHQTTVGEEDGELSDVPSQDFCNGLVKGR